MAYYEKLDIWKRSVILATDVYKYITKNTQFSKDFGLRDQVQRSSISVASNIAEGSERETATEFIRFLVISRGSLAELRTQLLIARNIKYLDDATYTLLEQESLEIHKMINALMSSLRSKNT